MTANLNLDEDWGRSGARNALRMRDDAVRQVSNLQVQAILADTYRARFGNQAGAAAVGVCVESLHDADVWAVSPSINNWIAKEAETFPKPPDNVLHSVNVPFPYGYVTLGAGLLDKAEPSDPATSAGHPLQVTIEVARQQNMLVYHALSWATVRDSNGRESLIIFPWYTLSIPYVTPVKPRQIPTLPVIYPLDVDLDHVDWRPDPFVKKANPPTLGNFPDWGSAYTWILRFTLSLWSWATDEVVTERQPLDRAQKRREHRAGRETTSVNVIKLRKVRRDSSDRGQPSDVSGIVTPHVRRSHPAWQPYGPGNKLRKLIRRRSSVVNAHLLGDDDSMPEAKPRVFNVDR